jgi:hypothetical protein
MFRTLKKTLETKLTVRLSFKHIRQAAFLIPAACLIAISSPFQSVQASQNQPYFIFYNITINLSAQDFGLTGESLANPHGSFQGTASWVGGNVTGTTLPITDYGSSSTITKTNILFWEYVYGGHNVNFSDLSYVITNPNIVHQTVQTSVIKITSITPKTTIRSTPQPGGPYWTYSGFADLTLDVSGAFNSGTYTGGVITISVTAQ